jgi:hypothetical protein
MSTRQERERGKYQERQERDGRNARIGQRVIHILGQPDELREVQVRRLWEDHYRVNVLVGADAFSAKIASSYFVEADADGNIIESTPKLVGPS